LQRVNFLGFKVWVPNHPVLRLILGIIFILGGFLGFLPILGFWMLPLGLIILSIDFPMIRKWRRKMSVKLGLWLQQRWPNFAKKLGFNGLRASR
jgi:purine-cytosine permease-like protein